MVYLNKVTMGTLETDDEKPGQFVCSTNILITILQENKLTVHICKVLLKIKCNSIEHSSASAFDGHRLNSKNKFME